MGVSSGAVSNVRTGTPPVRQTGEPNIQMGRPAPWKLDKTRQSVSDGTDKGPLFSESLGGTTKAASPPPGAITSPPDDAAPATDDRLPTLFDPARNADDAAAPPAKTPGGGIADADGVRVVEDILEALLHGTGDVAESVAEKGILATALGLDDNPHPIAFANWLSGR